MRNTRRNEKRIHFCEEGRNTRRNESRGGERKVRMTCPNFEPETLSHANHGSGRGGSHTQGSIRLVPVRATLVLSLSIME